MTIEYAKAYSNERITHAETKRLQREAMMHEVAGDWLGGPIRTAVGTRLINMGEQLSANRPGAPSTVKGHT